MSEAILKLEMRNFRKSTREGMSDCHAECDVFLDGKFISSYTWNPFYNAKMDFKNGAACMRRMGAPTKNMCDSFMYDVWTDLIFKYSDEKAKEYWNIWCGKNWGKKFTDDFHKKFTDMVWEEVKPVYPNAYDVESSLVCDASCVEGLTFEDFCDDFGYSSDSISALKIYHDCQKILNVLVRTGKYQDLVKLHAED